MVVPLFEFLVHGGIDSHDMITQHGMVPVYGVATIYDAVSFKCLYWKYVPGFTVAYNECGVHQMPNDSPQPHELELLGLLISNCDPKVSSIQSTLVPATYSMDVSSTTKRPVPQSST